MMHGFKPCDQPAYLLGLKSRSLRRVLSLSDQMFLGISEVVE
jgi:hypothetical protein